MGSSCVVVEGSEVFQGSFVAKLILVLSLDHSWPLGPQHFDRLKDVDYPFVLHPLEHDAQRYEDARSADAGTAVYSYRSILTKLIFSLQDLADEIDETLTRLGDSLFWPLSELKLSDRSRLSISCIRDFEFTQDVLRHVVL